MIGAAMTTNPKERKLYGDFPWKCMFMGGEETPDGDGNGPIGVFFCSDRAEAEKWVKTLGLHHPNPSHPLLVGQVVS